MIDSESNLTGNLGFHPAPQTTTLTVELPTRWDNIPNDDRSVRVTCAPNAGNWRIVGEVPLRSGLP